MKDYLVHWWNGDLANYYRFFNLTIPQINKIAKIGLYIVGLLTLFELIKFARVMEGMKWASSISVFLFRFVQLVFSIPFLIVGIVLAILGFIFRQLTFKDAILFPFWYHLSTAKRQARRESQSHISVLFFDWLKEQPITERVIKTSGFVLFVIFAVVELFTS